MHDLLKLTRDDPGSPLVGRDRAQSSRSQWAAGNRHGTALEQAKLNGFFLGQGSTVKVVSWWVHGDFEFEKHIQHHTTKIAPLVAQNTPPRSVGHVIRRSVVSEAPKLHFQLHCMLHLQRSSNIWQPEKKHEKKPEKKHERKSHASAFDRGWKFSDFLTQTNSEHVLQAKWMSKSAKVIHFPAVGMLVTKARHQGASAYPGKSILTWRAQRLVVESPIPTTIYNIILYIYIHIYIYMYIHIEFARRRAPKSTI